MNGDTISIECQVCGTTFSGYAATTQCPKCHPVLKTREQLIATAREQREEIKQYFRDVQYWNATRGKAAGMIDADPDGTMNRLLAALDKMLKAEDAKTDVSTCDACGGPMPQAYAAPFGSLGDGEHYCAECAGVQSPNVPDQTPGTDGKRIL